MSSASLGAALDLARAANDELAELVGGPLDPFAGFAGNARRLLRLPA